MIELTYGWWVLSDPVEMVPVNDIHEHGNGVECWCRPFDDDGMLVHVAADQREKYETGRRRPH